jgi:rhamnose utilization protein RhaD (predicted bifunctional aldolase and dehydrogenase)
MRPDDEDELMVEPGHGSHDAEFWALRETSARIGADPLLVQGAGGNTSIKVGDVLWIKASGTWLKNAARDDIMVPVALGALVAAVAEESPEADTPQRFTIAEGNLGGLRPSIETTVHALMPQRIVIHVHCVETIALAVRTDAEALVAERLQGLNWAYVPYSKPGLALARAIAARLRPQTDVLLLGNHGIVVAADTVAEAEALLRRVSGLLSQPARSAPAADLDALRRLAGGSGYRLPEIAETHATATDPVSCRIAAAGSMYPDHVIFLGESVAVAGPAENAAAVVAREKASGRDPMLVLFPGKGALIKSDANAGAEAMARCLADVTARLPADAAIRYLTTEEVAELLDWDAEKYRQALNRQGEAIRQ